MRADEAPCGAYLVEVDGRHYFVHKLRGRGWCFMDHSHQASPERAVQRALEGGNVETLSLELLLQRYPGIRIVSS